MFKRVRGPRAWLLAAGSLLGIAAAVISYADVAEFFLPATATKYLPLVMLAGFACPLWALGTEDVAVDGVLYREVLQLRQDNQRLKQSLGNLCTSDMASAASRNRLM